MLAFVLAFELLVFALACVGMMAAFLGGGGYLGALLVLLGLSMPVSLLVQLAGIAWFVKRNGFGGGFAALWRAVPQWLAIAFWLAITLVFCGELALVIALKLMNVPPAPWQHLPLLAGLLAAVAYCVIDAVREVRRKTLP